MRMFRIIATLSTIVIYCQQTLICRGQIVSASNTKHVLSLLSCQMDSVFFTPNHLLNVWVDEPISLEYYSEENVLRQKQINNAIAEEIVTKARQKGEALLTEIDREEITPFTWKWIDLELIKSDSTRNNIELRRPNWWIRQIGADSLGKKTYLYIPELGVEGWATVKAIRVNQLDTRLWDEKRDDHYLSRPITGKFEHESNNVYELKFSLKEELTGVTGEHPFWSNDRNNWVSAEQLVIGETVKTYEGDLKLVSRSKKEGKHKVFNIEVYRDHTYFVSTDKILVHNRKVLTIGSKKISDIVKTKNTLTLQLDVDVSAVEKIANDMANGKFNWNKMDDPIQIIQFADGKQLISEGTDRFLAAELSGTKIPWDNMKAIRITKTRYKSTDHKYARSWEEIDWK